MGDLFSAVRQGVSLVEYLKREDHDAVVGKPMLCPFHKDTKPSFMIYADGHGHCYGCGFHGAAIDAAMRNGHGLHTPLEAALWLADRYGIEYDDRPEAKVRREEHQRRVESLTQYAKRCHAALTGADRQRIRARGFTDDGIDRYLFGHHDPGNCPLKTFKRYKDEGAITIPFLSHRSHCSYMVLWRPNRPDGDQKKYINPASESLGNQPFISSPARQKRDGINGNEFHVVEGVFCYFSLLEAGFSAVLLFGTSYQNRLERLRELSPVICLDADNTGRRKGAALLSELYPVGHLLDLSHVLEDGQKDVNDIFQQHGAAALRERLAGCPRQDALEMVLDDEELAAAGKAHEAVELIAKVNAAIKRDELLKQVNAVTKVRITALREDLAELATDTDQDEEPDKGIPQSELLIRLCEAEIKEFIRDQFDTPHVLLPYEDHDELWPTSSAQFRELWLARRFRQKYGKPPGSEALRQARREVDAICSEQPRRTLFNRVAWLDDGYGGQDLWYDLSNDKWQAVRISSDGWTVEPAPAIFRRFKHQAPQVMPTGGDSTQGLFDFCNINEDDRCLFMTALVSYVVPDIPHPIMILHGRHGSAKSSTNRFIKDLIDPTHSSSQTGSATQKPPKEEDACAHVLDQHWLVAFDNITKMPEWFADMLCRASTGEAISQRKLYTDGEDHVRAYKRCCTLSVINMPVWRGDLIDRSIIIELTRPQKMKDEETLRKDWAEAKPIFLGALFDIIVAALRSIADIDKANLPRMADFAKWGRASEQACGYEAGTFDAAYGKSIQAKWEDSVELDNFAQKVIQVVEGEKVYDGKHIWTGTAEQLCQRVAQKASEHERPYLPQSGRSASSRLENMAPALESVGVKVTKRRESGTGKRIIRITRSAEENR